MNFRAKLDSNWVVSDFTACAHSYRLEYRDLRKFSRIQPIAHLTYRIKICLLVTSSIIFPHHAAVNKKTNAIVTSHNWFGNMQNE